MEGVGARLGRSSTRYGPATVFTGPVRKWKKKWIHVSPSSASSNSNANNHHNHASHASHLLLYKWTPLTHSQNTATTNNANAKDSPPEPPEEPPRRKFKYVPVFKLRFSSSPIIILGFYWKLIQFEIMEWEFHSRGTRVICVLCIV